MARHLTFITLLLILLGSTTALAGNPQSAYVGHRLYVSHCMLCHGADGKGAGPLAKNLGLTPSDLTTTTRSRSDTILKKIISGKGQPTISGRDRHNVLTDAMPNWGEILVEDQVDALIAYLRYLSTAKYPLPGDPADGAELYQKYCMVCHGEDGYGDGPMTSIMDVEPEDLSNPIVMNDMTNEEMITAINEGDDEYMPAWEGILDVKEIEALVSFIRLLSQ